MIPWTLLAEATIPKSEAVLSLSQRGDEFAIRISGVRGDLMNSRMHGSEDALAELACARLKALADARVLVGGLGMGFTLAAALNAVSPSALVTVAELVPEVVEWNQGPLGEAAGYPLNNNRTLVHIGDVTELLLKQTSGFDAILLDVDNGPAAITQSDNEWLYSTNGLKAIYKTLRPEGILAIWSAGHDQRFVSRLKRTGYSVEVRRVRARARKGSRHIIFLAQRPLRSIQPKN